MFSSTAAALSARYRATGLLGEHSETTATASASAAAGPPQPQPQAAAADAEAGKAGASGSGSGVGIGGLPLQTSATPAPIDPRAIKLQAVRDEGAPARTPRATPSGSQ